MYLFLVCKFLLRLDIKLHVVVNGLCCRQEVLLLDNEIAFNEAVIEEREQGIEEIQQQIGEVNEIFKDLAVLVHDQGVMIGKSSFLTLLIIIFLSGLCFLMWSIYICRWYWIQYWGRSCCNWTGEVSTCKGFEDPKIKFISGNLLH